MDHTNSMNGEDKVSSSSPKKKNKAVDRKDLYTEPKFSSGRFGLSLADNKVTLTDSELPATAGREREIPVIANSEIRDMSIKFLQDLVEVANCRDRTFDYLLNCDEALKVLLKALRQCFPALQTSHLLQPLVDLECCFHELVIGRSPGIIVHRDPLFDGGYRWLETFDEAQSKGEPFYISGTRRVLTWADMQEAKIAVAYDALVLAYGNKRHEREASKKEMENLLDKIKIEHFDEKRHDHIVVEDAIEWRKRAGEKGRNAGLRYCVQVYKKKFGKLKPDELEPKLGNYEIRLKMPEAVVFAEGMITQACFLQPSKHPEPGLEVIEERRKHAIKLGRPKSPQRGDKLKR